MTAPDVDSTAWCCRRTAGLRRQICLSLLSDAGVMHNRAFFESASHVRMHADPHNCGACMQALNLRELIRKYGRNIGLNLKARPALSAASAAQGQADTAAGPLGRPHLR